MTTELDNRRGLPRFSIALALLLASSIAPDLRAQQSSAEAGSSPSAAASDLSDEVVPGGEGPPGLRSIRIVGTALRPRQDNVSYTVNASGGCFYVTTGAATTIWNIPILLPQGARVDTLRIYYNDASAANLTAWFTVYDVFGAIVNEWDVSSTGSGGNGFADTLQINHFVDYSNYSYAVNVRPIGSGSSLQFCGLRIFYEG